MSNLTQFFAGGEKTVTKIVNNQSSGGNYSSFSNMDSIWSNIPAKIVSSGSVTANTLKTILSITGAGYLDIVGISSVNTTARTHRIKITLDGITSPQVAFDATSQEISTSYYGMLAIGNATSIGSFQIPTALPTYFAKSCLVEFASSLTETDKQYLLYAYRLL